MDQEQPAVVIKMVNNGPYQVKGPMRLVDHTGNAFDVPERRSVLLCRCGQSANKPFCDGAHARTGFQSEESASLHADETVS